MPHYLLSIYQPDGGVPDAAAMARITADLHRLNEELREGGSWVFTGDLGAMRGMALEVSTQDVCHEVNLSRGGQFISYRARARYACRTDWYVLANDGYAASYWRNYHQREPGRRLLWKA